MSEPVSGVPRLAWRLSLVAIASFILGPLGAHFGLTKPLTGFLIFAIGGILGVASLVLGAIGYLRNSGAARATAGRGLAVSAVVSMIFLFRLVQGSGVPRINDITTDTQRPPKFVFALTRGENAGRDMDYPGSSFAEQQKKAYPDIGARLLPIPPTAAYVEVVELAKQDPNWKITRDDPGALTLEGVATSQMFRFQDDFIIEVRQDVNGSAVHMRSKSHDGQGDFGVNAARIRAFLAKLN